MSSSMTSSVGTPYPSGVCLETMNGLPDQGIIAVGRDLDSTFAGDERIQVVTSTKLLPQAYPELLRIAGLDPP